MRLAIVPWLLWGSASAVALGADDSSGRPPRSHIAPVGEVAATKPSAPWAGLVTARAPAVLREQFRLERGAGLVVESVASGSVAERVGLKRHDVLVSIDGQLLLLTEQFVALLEASGADAPLQCRVLRGGVEQTISLRWNPTATASGPLQPAASKLALVPTKPPNAEAASPRSRDGSTHVRHTDYQVKLTGGTEQRLVVKDGRGRIVFNGPIDTPEQRSLVPPEVRGRVEGLERLAEQQRSERAAPAGAPDEPSQPRTGAFKAAPLKIR